MPSTEIIDNPAQFEQFYNHLTTPNNSRIIFSGKFGIGKTTFLQEFFKTYNSKYTTIHLYPVNYSISPNEDILGLLKYDIINELINNHPIKTEEFDFNNAEILTEFIKSNYDGFLAPIISSIPKIGKLAAPIYTNILKLIPKYEEFKKKINSGESIELKKLGELIEKKNGSFYQNDFYTDFISRKLNEIKEENANKENVLIIDDLDRIDPEHIFRLFNIFAAHLHNNNETNKFGFDKIIFTCDIDNIESIYRHKYGKNVDFTGYIDKFYSHTVHRIDNRSVIQFWISKRAPIDATKIYGGETAFIADIFNNMLECDVLNFRNIKSIDLEVVEKNFNSIIRKNRTRGVFENVNFIWVAPLLSVAAGGTNLLIKKLSIAKERWKERKDDSFSNSPGNAQVYVEDFLIPVAEYKTHRLGTAGNYIFHMKNIHPKSETKFGYTLSVTNPMVRKITSKLEPGDPVIFKEPPTDRLFNIIIWDFLINAIIELKEQGYLY